MTVDVDVDVDVGQPIQPKAINDAPNTRVVVIPSDVNIGIILSGIRIKLIPIHSSHNEFNFNIILVAGAVTVVLVVADFDMISVTYN